MLKRLPSLQHLCSVVSLVMFRHWILILISPISSRRIGPCNLGLFQALRRVWMICFHIEVWEQLKWIDLREAWLEELGVSGDSGVDKLEEIGRQLASARVVKRKGFVNPEKLAKNWKIGLEVAKKTIDATTQLAVRDFTDSEGGKHIRQSSWVLNFRCINCDVYCDTYHGTLQVSQRKQVLSDLCDPVPLCSSLFQ